MLFLFYINNLASTLNDDAVIALFANYDSILTTTRKRKGAEAAAQSVVNSVLSQEYKLNLNAEKSEVCPSLPGQAIAPGIQLSLLAIRTFVLTPLLVSSA